VPPPDPQLQRQFAVEVVGTLRERGFEAYWAGGCVRDQLLGRTPKDFDVATSARPDEIRSVFGPRRTIAIGAAFGVITVLGPNAAGQIEVATFRQDAEYSDGRRPDSVAFSTPEADAQRRDFTINGLFYDPLADRVIDFVEGGEDLKRRVVRAIGEPRARFAEDKLRLLRAVRFAATFDFTLDAATRQALEAMAPQVTVVSAERIAAEIRLMLVHESRAGAMALVSEVGLLAAVLPEMSMAGNAGVLTAIGRPAYEAWAATLAVLERLAECNFPTALSALLHAFVDPAGVEAICRRWKLSNRDTQRTRWLVENKSTLAGARHMAWPKLQRVLIAEGIDDLLHLHEVLAQTTGGDGDDVDYCRELLQLSSDELNPPPLITGDDLIEHGVPRGKPYQRLLEAVRDAQLEKKITSRDQALALVDQLRQTMRDQDEYRK
jgi:poly(A) polymerase